VEKEKNWNFSTAMTRIFQEYQYSTFLGQKKSIAYYSFFNFGGALGLFSLLPQGIPQG